MTVTVVLGCCLSRHVGHATPPSIFPGALVAAQLHEFSHSSCFLHGKIKPRPPGPSGRCSLYIFAQRVWRSPFSCRQTSGEAAEPSAGKNPTGMDRERLGGSTFLFILAQSKYNERNGWRLGVVQEDCPGATNGGTASPT